MTGNELAGSVADGAVLFYGCTGYLLLNESFKTIQPAFQCVDFGLLLLDLTLLLSNGLRLRFQFGLLRFRRFDEHGDELGIVHPPRLPVVFKRAQLRQPLGHLLGDHPYVGRAAFLPVVTYPAQLLDEPYFRAFI